MQIVKKTHGAFHFIDYVPSEDYMLLAKLFGCLSTHETSHSERVRVSELERLKELDLCLKSKAISIIFFSG